MHKLVNGTKVKLTSDEVKARQSEEAQNLIDKESYEISSFDKKLESACYSYQINRDEGGLNPNFFALVTAIKALHSANGTDMPVKAKAVLDWADALWAECRSRKGDHTRGLDFSNMGSVPYSFSQVRMESEPE